MRVYVDSRRRDGVGAYVSGGAWLRSGALCTWVPLFWAYPRNFCHDRFNSQLLYKVRIRHANSAPRRNSSKTDVITNVGVDECRRLRTQGQRGPRRKRVTARSAERSQAWRRTVDNTSLCRLAHARRCRRVRERWCLTSQWRTVATHDRTGRWRNRMISPNVGVGERNVSGPRRQRVTAPEGSTVSGSQRQRPATSTAAMSA